MLALVWGAIWGVLVIYLLSRVLRQFYAFRETTLMASSGGADMPAVSIIVPVRNEFDNIEQCIAGLTAQTCLTDRSSIIIVDDDSQDGTAAVLERRIALDPRIRAIAAGPLPRGWVGKPHACWRGALVSRGDWLCFIDADVRAAPELIASAVTVAQTHGIDMLSLHPSQELGSFWERIIFPAGLLMIACAKSFVPASADNANGQFLLVRREVYFQVGGHAAVRVEICEDKTLAGLVKQAGFCFRVFAAEHLARTRMYRDLGSLWEGLSKNATEILGSSWATLTAAFVGLAVGWTALLLPITTGAATVRDPSTVATIGAGLALLGSAVVVGIHLAMARHFHIPVIYGLLFALGYTITACLACSSVLAHIDGRVTWKGRIYRLDKSAPDGA
ncbi:MAG: glycosyltransferase [Stellaceae bacterium]|jgi:chlorobactene glucosyltransferase